MTQSYNDPKESWLKVEGKKLFTVNGVDELVIHDGTKVKFDPNNTPASDEPQSVIDRSNLTLIFTDYMSGQWNGNMFNDILDWHTHEMDKAKAAITALRIKDRIDELKALPWKRADRYGINSPYVTKAWLRERITELESQLNIGGSNAKQ